MSDSAERAAERITAEFLRNPPYSLPQKQVMADIIRAENGELMPCGHRRACFGERLAPLWSGDPPSSTTDYCTACEREAAAVEATREECALLADEFADMPRVLARKIRALDVAGALDRKVNEARLDEARIWNKAIELEAMDDIGRAARIAALEEALTK